MAEAVNGEPEAVGGGAASTGRARQRRVEWSSQVLEIYFLFVVRETSLDFVVVLKTAGASCKQQYVCGS